MGANQSTADGHGASTGTKRCFYEVLGVARDASENEWARPCKYKEILDADVAT